MIIFLIIIVLIVIFYNCRSRKITTILDENKTVLITGGCMGIGRLMVELLLQLKCKVIVLDVRDDLKDDKRVEFYYCDLSQIELIDKVVTQILKKHKINILINNAGVAPLKLFKDQSDKDMLLVNSVNYLAPMKLMSLMIPHMESNGGGRIVNIGSVVSVLHGLKCSTYIASKHAFYGLHKSVQLELRLLKSPVQMTFVAPWAIDTGMFKGIKSKIDFIFPILKPEFVADQVIWAIRTDQDFVSIKWYMFQIARAMQLLPEWLNDWMAIKLQGPFVHDLVGRRT